MVDYERPAEHSAKHPPGMPEKFRKHLLIASKKDGPLRPKPAFARNVGFVEEREEWPVALSSERAQRVASL
jgi:hypothetical protein